MKKILFLSLILIVAISSCKKEDNKMESAQTAENAVIVSDWKTVEWNASDSIYEGALPDEKISSDIVSNGLILVYAKSNNTNQLLPAKIGNSNLFYQVENGSVKINANNTSPNEALQFSYIVFSKEQLNTLAQKGITTLELIKMNYEQVKQIKN